MSLVLPVLSLFRAAQVNDGDNLIQPIDARNVAQVLMAIIDDPVRL